MNYSRENRSFNDLIAKRKELDEQINKIRYEEGRMDVGGTHFMREWDICRRSDYTLQKITNELVDNVIKDCSEIHIKTIITGGYLSEFRCSDNKDRGFESIRQKGTSNPMNFTHMRTGQNDDNCLSRNGRGMKGGAASSCTKLTIYTNSNNNDKVKVVADFPKMAAEIDCNESYNPRIFKVSDEDFRYEHGREFGSTIVLENIRKNLYKRTNEMEITTDLMNKISETYTPLLRENPQKILKINDCRILPEKDYFEEPECAPLNVSYNIFRVETDNGEEFIAEEKSSESVELLIYNKDSGHFNKMKPKEKKAFGFDKSAASNITYLESFPGHNECIRVKATNVMYHPDFNNEDVDMPRSRARLRMSGRRYGNWNKDANNGSGNYIDIDVDLATKKTAEELGLTWNKEIANKQENDIAKALYSIIKERISAKLNCDTSTTANKKLYDKAIKLGINVPKSRLPTSVKQSESKSEKPKKKIIIDDEDENLEEKKDDHQADKFTEKLCENLDHHQEDSFEELEEKNDEDKDDNIEEEISKKYDDCQEKYDDCQEKYDDCQEKYDDCQEKYDDCQEKYDDYQENNLEEKLSEKTDEVQEDNLEGEFDKYHEDILDQNLTDLNLVLVSKSQEESENFILKFEEKEGEKTENIENIETIEQDKNSAELIEPKLSKVGETIRQTLTISKGKKALVKIMANQQGILYDENLKKILFEYLDNCAKSQIEIVLNYLTFDKKCDLLIKLINDKYKYRNEETEKILCGADLYDILEKLKEPID